MTTRTTQVLSGLLGLCIGDALGVPVEFTSRAERANDAVQEMRGYGTWHQPPGTWSDDSALALCLAEAMCQGFSLEQIAQNFCRWHSEAYWTAHGEVFDVGQVTAAAIARLRQGYPPLKAGGTEENSNGNGSLMRILPMVFYYPMLDFTEIIHRTHQVSAITHAHPRSQMACGIYLSVAVGILQGLSLENAYQQGIQHIQPFYHAVPFAAEHQHFHRIFGGNLGQASIDSIRSGGYVIDTLEAALWCLLNSQSYAEAVLLAVNLGEDTDTTGAVTGGLAGLFYGVEAIPPEWIEALVRRDDIMALAHRCTTAIAALHPN